MPQRQKDLRNSSEIIYNFAMVILSAFVKRFSVSCLRDLKKRKLNEWLFRNQAKNFMAHGLGLQIAVNLCISKEHLF